VTRIFVLKIQDWSTKIKVAAQKPLRRHTDDDKPIIIYNGHKEVFGCINIPAKIAFNWSHGFGRANWKVNIS